MPFPLEIVARDLSLTPEVEQQIRDKSAKLERFYARIIGCRVVVEAPHRHHHKGVLYHLRIHLMVPGEELVVDREPGDRDAHEELQVAVRDAFDAASRQLKDYVERRRD